jgi:hypothetical protein
MTVMSAVKEVEVTGLESKTKPGQKYETLSY